MEVFRVNLSAASPCPFVPPIWILTNNVRERDADNLTQFGSYLLFPIGIMYYFGTNLDNRFAVEGFWPKADEANKIPHSREEIKAEYARIVERQRILKERREAAERKDE